MFLLALGLRLAAVALIHPTPPIAEEAIHVNRALLGAKALPTHLEFQRAPGVIFFFDGVAAVFGRDPLPLRIADAVLGGLFVPLFLMWSMLVVPYRIALVASLLLAVHPELVFFSASLWNEPLYLFLLAASLLFHERVLRTGSLRAAIVTGALLGALSLTRETGLSFAALLLLLTAFGPSARRVRSVLCAALLLASCVAVVLPWSLDMTRRAGRPIVVTALNVQRLYIGNMPVPGDADPSAEARIHYLGSAFHELSDAGGPRNRRGRQQVIDEIRREMPGWPLWKTYRGLRDMLGFNSFPVARLLAQPGDRGWAGTWAFRFADGPLDRRRGGAALAWITLVFHALLVTGGAAGLALLRPRRRAALVLPAIAVVHVAPPVVAFACSRYRVPLIPLFALGAAGLPAGGRTAWRAASRRRRIAAFGGAIAAVVLLALSASRLLPPQYG